MDKCKSGHSRSGFECRSLQIETKNWNSPMDTYELLESIPFPITSTTTTVKVTKSKCTKKKLCPNDTLGLFVFATGPSTSSFIGNVRVAGGLVLSKFQPKILEMICC